MIETLQIKTVIKKTDEHILILFFYLIDIEANIFIY